MLSPTKRDRSGNLLLDNLPKEEHHRLLRSSEAVSLPHGFEIYRQGRPISHVYFPRTGAISIMIFMEDGKAIHAACVGNEGMVGLPIFFGLDFSPGTVIAQVPGQSVRIPSAIFAQALRSGAALGKLVRRYVAYSLRFADQIAACNRFHSVQQRMCWWLLTAQDRNGQQEELLFTHEFLAEMLGVRRQTVSAIAASLQSAGVISYHRGILRIIDRQGLVGASCECYSVTKTFYDEIMR
jgi:CRP-like cAMP-binding protein